MGRDRFVDFIAGGGRESQIPERCLRHRAADNRSVVSVYRDGQYRVVVQRITQTGGSHI